MSLLLAGAIGLTGLPAHAQDPAGGEDVVNLKNGGMIRGKVLEVMPDESVTIESSATGERKTIPWSEVAGVERGGQASAPAEPADEEEPAASAPQTGPGRPRVHIELTRQADVHLNEIVSEMVATGYVAGGGTATIRGITYRPICVAPCDQVVDGSQGRSYFFSGDGVPSSKRFSLLSQSGDIVAKVKPGRTGLRVGGVIAMSLGFATAVAGGLLFIFAKPRPRLEFDMMGNATTVEKPANYTPPIAVLVSGLVLTGAGIAMYVVGRTRFQLEPRGLALGRRVRLHAGNGLTARF